MATCVSDVAWEQSFGEAHMSSLDAVERIAGIVQREVKPIGRNIGDIE